jgi:endonuclease/exonuclease/phosphatase family metal-dependent hydrolase
MRAMTEGPLVTEAPTNVGVAAMVPREGVAGLVAVAAAVAVGFQCLRVMFPLAYSYREESGVTRTVIVLVAVFATPALAPLLARVAGAPRALVGTAVALVLVRVTVQLADPIPLALAAVAAAIGLLSVASGVVAFRHRGVALVVAIVGGLALDCSIRAAWSTWDVAWQDDVLTWSVTIALAAALAVAAVVGRRDASDVPGSVGRFGLALGAYFAVQVWFLQSVAFAASSAGVSLATATLVVLAGDVLALLLVATWPRPSGGAAAAGATAVGAGLVCWWLPRATGIGVAVLVVAGQALLSVLLAWTVASPGRTRHHPVVADTVGLVAGMALFGSVVLLYQLHYDLPLPVSNRWLPALAGAVLAVCSLWHREPARMTTGGRGAVAVAGAISLGGLVLFLGLTSGEPDTTVAATSGTSLRVVTYNPHEAVTRDGQLDLDAFGDTVERLRPDVLVIEEAGRGWQLSAGVDLAEWGKRRLGLPYVWGPAADHQFGNVVFSRVPVLDARVVPLPRANGTMRRSAVVARVGPIAGEPVTVVGAHLQNGGGAAGRASRLAEIRALTRALPHELRRTVVAGDLNSDPGSPELHALLGLGFETRQPTEHCTLTTSNDNCSDWILVTPDLEQRLLEVVPFDAFDHRPVVADVRSRGSS